MVVLFGWGVPAAVVIVLGAYALIQIAPWPMPVALCWVFAGVTMALGRMPSHVLYSPTALALIWFGVAMLTPLATTWFARKAPGGPCGIIRSGVQSGIVHLTFDDGPSEKYTPAILTALRASSAQATFFVLGRHAEQFPHLIRDMVTNGHAVGVHGQNHRPLVWLSRANVRAELGSCVAALNRCGASPTLMRPPWGLHSRLVRQEAAALGLTMVLWTHSVRDWTNPGSAAVCRTLLSRADSHSILLLHDSSHDQLRACTDTVEGLKQALPLLYQRGLVCQALP